MIIALIRTVILYLLIIFGIRLMGKRQIGQLEPAELVLSLLIADLAAVPMQDYGTPLASGVIPILTLLCLSTILSVLSMKSVRFRAILCSRPSVVVQDGRVIPREMRKNRFTVDELMEELRTNGYTDLTKIKYAILETNGRISVLPNAVEQPATAGQLHLPVTEAGLPLIIINDGRLLHRNLTTRGKSQAWLDKQLRARGFSSVEEVFLMTLDENGAVYCTERG